MSNKLEVSLVRRMILLILSLGGATGGTLLIVKNAIEMSSSTGISLPGIARFCVGAVLFAVGRYFFVRLRQSPPSSSCPVPEVR